MIAPLRRIHRGVFVCAAVILPVLFATALALRPDRPLVASFPENLRPASAVSLERAGPLLGDVPSARIARDGRRLLLELTDENVADGLLYWAPRAAAGSRGSAPPPGARLLGGSARRGRFELALPADLSVEAGDRLLVISVPHGVVEELIEVRGED